ncbi:MAG TPA: virulence RhuM family protein [Rhabdochlamydiaceae bacterium]|nr:virulence RhuM family protein [Rhabdochlamydiaceae bacterium]
MPTPYLPFTEDRALEEYRKKLETTEQNVVFKRIEPPGPDAIFQVGSNRNIWVEVTSVFDNQEGAEFLNKNGLSDSNTKSTEVHSIALGTSSENSQQILNGIEKSINKKDGKASYDNYLKRFGKGVLILYIDQPMFSNVELKAVLEANAFSDKVLKNFHAVYLYVPATECMSGNMLAKIGGFYSLLERGSLLQSKGEFLLFQTEEATARVEVLMQGETVWLTLNEMAKLFQIHKSGISRHLKNIFETSELQKDATVANFATVQEEGMRKIVRDMEYFNLEVVIAVGYRINSHRGTQFRIWATNQLKEFIIKGFVLDDARLKQASNSTYFEQLLARIRDIRSSERVFWRKVLDIYATSIDYDPKNELTLQFFKVVQNKMHWAAHGHTASEVIYQRADSHKPHMGMTSWVGNIPRKTDAIIAKNYLNEEEIRALNRIVTAYLEFAELQALNRQPMYMADWIAKLDDFLKLSSRNVLADAGKVSHEAALERALREYEKYQKELDNQPSPIEEHFLKVVQEIEKKQDR